jgi:hypothetical protein
VENEPTPHEKGICAMKTPSPASDAAQLAQARIDEALRLGEEEKLAEEIAIYDEVVRRFGDDPMPTVREQVAQALVNKYYYSE